MKIVYITEAVNKEMVDKVAEALSVEGDIKFYLNSHGGSRPMSKTIVDMINQNKDRVELIAQGDLYSAAFRIFWKCLCKKRLMPETRAIWHMGTKDHIDLGYNGKPHYDWELWETKQFVKDNKKQVKELKQLNVTKKELKKFSKGKDLYFGYKRLCKLFPDAC